MSVGTCPVTSPLLILGSFTLVSMWLPRSHCLSHWQMGPRYACRATPKRESTLQLRLGLPRAVAEWTEPSFFWSHTQFSFASSAGFMGISVGRQTGSSGMPVLFSLIVWIFDILLYCCFSVCLKICITCNIIRPAMKCIPVKQNPQYYQIEAVLLEMHDVLVNVQVSADIYSKPWYLSFLCVNLAQYCRLINLS